MSYANQLCQDRESRQRSRTRGHGNQTAQAGFVDLLGAYLFDCKGDSDPILILGVNDKDDYQMLKFAFKCKTAPAQRQDVILRDRGVRWAGFNVISDWLPASKTVLDFMHNIFLGMFVLSARLNWLALQPGAACDTAH
jgi:hypothetical protein